MKRTAPQCSPAGAWLPPPPQRFRPPHGGKLTIAAVRGHWRFSGTTNGQGLPAVLWTTRSGVSFWAPLTDFYDDAILGLVRQAVQLDTEQSGVA